ncbi:unnamed protein product [Schistocephalus solidus]|uniref:Reverse transcriptase domain-containing protein n=1 Tax=Schistocephalus solidus TaxID=70667 RepID=A0A183TGB2_SCHSO|nr:unnamed protein product [Schistocephalus solidus]
MSFVVRQLQGRCQDMRIHLYSSFMDMTKAFDTVNREGLWNIMQNVGCPERFTHMLCQPHDSIMTHGVKQGCVLTPNLFSLMFSVMFMNAYPDKCPKISITSRMDDQLLDQRRMYSQMRVSTTKIQKLLFADDCAFNATTGWDMQRSMHLFAAAC